MFILDQFIADSVTKRPVSMFAADIETNRNIINDKNTFRSNILFIINHLLIRLVIFCHFSATKIALFINSATALMHF